MFFRNCIEQGLYFHTDFTVSAQHDDRLLAQALDALRAAVVQTQQHVHVPVA
jgi:hypothetical protein